MRKIMNFVLTPEMVKVIKQVEDGMGVQLIDCDWLAQEASNVDIHEICYTYSRAKDVRVLKADGELAEGEVETQKEE